LWKIIFLARMVDPQRETLTCMEIAPPPRKVEKRIPPSFFGNNPRFFNKVLALFFAGM
jgi:hypothetical protein